MQVAPLFVLIRRLPFSLLAEVGDRKGRAGLASAAPSPWSPGPEVQRPRAPPAASWNLAGRGAGPLGAGVEGKCCPRPPLARFPCNPEDCWPSIGSVALRCHSCYLPSSSTGGRPRSPRGRSWFAGLL